MGRVYVKQVQRGCTKSKRTATLSGLTIQSKQKAVREQRKGSQRDNFMEEETFELNLESKKIFYR